MIKNLEEAATEDQFNKNWDFFVGKCKSQTRAGRHSVLDYMEETWYTRRTEWAYAWKKTNFTAGFYADSVSPHLFRHSNHPNAVSVVCAFAYVCCAWRR